MKIITEWYSVLNILIVNMFFLQLRLFGVSSVIRQKGECQSRCFKNIKTGVSHVRVRIRGYEIFVFRIIWRALFSRKTRSEIRLLPCYGGTCLIFGVYGLIASWDWFSGYGKFVNFEEVINPVYSANTVIFRTLEQKIRRCSFVFYCWWSIGTNIKASFKYKGVFAKGYVPHFHVVVFKTNVLYTKIAWHFRRYRLVSNLYLNC